jgi:hypothetical protein
LRPKTWDNAGKKTPKSTNHCDAEESAAGEELAVGLAEAGTKFEDDEENVVDDEGPFTAIAICCDTWFGC